MGYQEHQQEQDFGEWVVDHNDDDTAVVINFVHMSDIGVEHFITAMPPQHALRFAEAVSEKAKELL